ncbi:MAG: InlB B-repeat-containing protein [Clostridia bacterium]|nr:InlB B-repeat-containing protein [Clostridia bacterium]
MTRTEKRRSKLQKALSVLLTCLMLLGASAPGFGALRAFADNSGRILSSGWSVKIAVPETVYMEPQDDCSATTTTVKYYVNNTMDYNGNVSCDREAAATGGKFYFYCPQATAINSVQIDGATLQDFNWVKDGAFFFDRDDVIHLTLTSGLSSANTRTLEWMIQCEMTDGTIGTFYAYTVAYAPYLSPVFAAGRCKNTRGSNSFGSGMSWVSGIHGISTAGGYFPYSSFLPLLGGPTVGNGETSPDAWFNGSQQCHIPTKGGWYTSKEYGYNYGDETLCVYERSAEAFINVDTSRYSNLNQVPNLVCGIAVTDAEGVDNGNIYAFIGKLNNADDRVTSGRNWYTRSNTTPSEWNAGCAIWGGSRSAGQNKQYMIRDVRMNLAVPSGWIYIRGALKTASGGDNCFCILDNYLNVVQVNKSSWRSALQAAQSYGFQREWFTDPTQYDSWRSALRSVGASLGNPAATSCATTTLTNLTETLAAAYSGANNGAQVNDLAFVKVLGSTGAFSNQWKVIALPGVTNPVETETIRAGHALTLKSAACTGFTYKGNLRAANQKAAGTTFTNADPSAGLGLINTDANVVYKHITQTQIANGEHRRTFYYQGDDATVTINPNGGAWNGSTANSTVTGSYKTEWTPANPTRTGYTFAGWEHTAGTDSTCSGGVFTFGRTKATLKAKWSVNQYTITFDTDGGGAIAPITQDYGTAITPPAAPTKAGFAFNGWSPALPETMPAGDLTVTAQWIDLSVTVIAHSLSLNGDIGVNFYVDIPCATDEAYAEFTVAGQTVTVPIDLSRFILQDGVKLYKFTCNVHSAQTALPITGYIRNGEMQSDPINYSVHAYLDEAMTSPDTQGNAKLMRLASAIATYAYYANALLGYDDNFAQQALFDDSGMADVTAASLADQAAQIDDTADGVLYYGSSLVLHTTTAIRHYFALPANTAIDDFTFTLGAGNSAVTLTPKASGKYYFVEIPDVASAELGLPYTVTVTNAGGDTVNTWTYSALSYAFRALDSDTATAETVNAAKALVLYYQAAIAYFTPNA